MKDEILDAGLNARPAMEHMVIRYGKRLLRAAIMLCRDPDEAQDLVQEAFCMAMANTGRFRSESSPYTWLYAIMRNLFFKKYHAARRLQRFRSLFPVPVIPAAGEREFELQSFRSRLDKILERMPARHREILLLRYVEGLKILEIAGILGVSTGTVKSRLHHATRRLQRHFSGDGSFSQLLNKE